MPRQSSSRLVLGLSLMLLGASPSPGAAESKATVDYRQVQAILIGRCAKCHAAQGLMGPAPEGYRLTSCAETLAHDDRARVVPGAAEASELVRRIRGQARPRMPYDGPPYLDEQDIALIVDWINQGARDAEGRRAPMPNGARVRLHGTLQADWRLDGLVLKVNAATRMRRSPKPGDYVQVRGRLLNDGSLLVERIRPR
jgi:mono/diheme cytochrome c family protein